MDEDLFLSEQHQHSRRWAIVEDDGVTAWLYLTEPDSTRPVAHCWLYNRVHAPEGIAFNRGETPVVPAQYVVSTSPSVAPSAASVRFRWAPRGDGVAVLFGQELIGYISELGGPGHSKNIKVPGPFGVPLDLEGYAQVFG
jgi:hypothetical protein